ncbi:Lovastatin diketide synthase LovF [Daldinia childiae]|uniref:Lovastatin diketide synthase LovF n=1 Tax=Daldinia childiae TaxID=326645 RepID=UPI001447C6B0|nr:Lovastatin diketide synthase LovF [Daldinia childiae]KAF3056229.1 Lovastatin diketide synthase LovF [Daldinia childiae]
MSEDISKTDKVPSSRFNIDAYLHLDNERPGSFNVPGGHFLRDNPHAFDPSLFKISPVEAMWMDPQQKKLLEVVYEALENSGTTLEDAAGRNTGCYIGCFSYDFQFMTMKEPDFRHAYTATGVDTGILGNRISYVFDFKGPSLTVNTACSSSLYALDLACKAISTGECDSAIVGGSNIIMTVDQHMNTAKLGVLSPNSRSRPFDQAADGYGRAEGVGALYLMPLSLAIREGKPVRAVIRATATGSNGKHGDGVSGITHPSIEGQADVISLAYRLGKLSPSETRYVECHGTGTPIGDPAEVKAIHKAMGASRPQEDPILIGSVKANIGHSEAASSIGTLIKAVLALENGIIPPTAGVTKLSTSIPWDDMNVKVVTKPTGFPASASSRRIGVSAYGSMRHLKGIEEELGFEGSDDGRPQLLLFSAHDRPTLQNNIEAFSTSCQDASLVDLAYTLGLRRTKFQERAFAIARRETIESNVKDALCEISSAPQEAACLAFVFTGEMAAAYAAGLISAEAAITAAYFRGLVAANLSTDGAMVAVGIGPEEASRLIDELSCSSTVVVACHNSPTSTTLSGDRESVERLKEIFDEKKIFARMLKTNGKAYHSYHMKDVAARYMEFLEKEPGQISNSLAKVPMFSTVRTEKLNYTEGRIPGSYWVDNLTSPVLFNQGIQSMLNEMPEINLLVEVGPHSALSGPIRQICQAVDKKSVGYLPTLKRKEHDGDQMLRLAGGLWIRNADIDIAAVTQVEKLLDNGLIDVKRGSLLVDLPTYHWTYPKINFAESRTSREQRTVKEPRHDILGRRVAGTSALEFLWRNVLRRKDIPWITHHRLGGEVMLPATGYLALAIEAITQVSMESRDHVEIYSYTMRDVAITSAIVVPDDDEGTETLFRLQPMNNELGASKNGEAIRWFRFIVSSCSYGAWKEAATGLVALNVKGRASDHKPQVLPDTPHRASYIDWLEKNRTVGFDHGPAFRRISDIYTNDKLHVTRGDIRISKECGLMRAESRYVLHPAVLDACLQPFHATMHKGKIDDLRCGVIPTHFGETTIFPPSDEQLAGRCVVQTWCPPLGNRAFLSNVQLISHDGQLLVDMTDSRSLLYRSALPREIQDNPQQDLYVKLDWKIDADYLSWANEAGVLLDQPLTTIVHSMLHKNPDMHVLSLGDSLVQVVLEIKSSLEITIAAPSQEIKDVLKPRYSAYKAISFVDIDIGIPEIIKSNTKYDLILASVIDQVRVATLEPALRVLNPAGTLIIRTSADESQVWNHSLEGVGFSCVIDQALPDGTIMKIAINLSSSNSNSVKSHSSNIQLVYQDPSSPLLSVVSNRFKNYGWNVDLLPISSVDKGLGEQVILLDDADIPLLACLNEQDLAGLINLTERASAFTWVTCGGLLAGDKPEYGMTEGAARALRREKGSLDLVTVDFDAENTPRNRVAALLTDIADRQKTKGRNGEVEYYLRDGIVHIGRLVPHYDLNRQFVPNPDETTTVCQRDHPAVRAEIKNGTPVFLLDDDRVSEPLQPYEVEVHVAAMGLSAFDGADESTFLSHEIVGIVTRVGKQVDNLQPGTKVAGFALDRLATFQRTSAELVQPLPHNYSSSFKEAATLPSAFATAIYGLEVLARMEPIENVVIIDDMGAVALAAIQLCRVSKANAIVVTSSATAEDYIRNNKLLPSDLVVNSSNTGIGLKLQEVTAGKGVDIIFCSTAADKATVVECSRELTLFGRVVTFGHTSSYNPTVSALSTEAKSISLFHFDIAEIIRHRKGTIAKLLGRCMELYAAGDIKPLRPLNVIGPNEISETLQSIPSDMISGKIVVSYDQDALFKVVPSRKQLRFKEDVTYLMVGCLSGLGRQVALWMADRGAKHFAFISRTGTDNPVAAKTVQSLQNRGIEVLVLRANITCRDELTGAIAKLDPAFPIRGVVNAATVYRDATFWNMTISAWQEVVDTKVGGCLNLHEVLKNESLDFFVMTSSISATLGSSGQTNYSAANAFLDSLARHRRARGLPAVSLILPAVFGIGHIADDPELEKSIRMKGMYGIREKEMLEAFEVAMTPQSDLPSNFDHVMVGVQPRRFGHAVKTSGVHAPWEDDPRLNWIATAIEGENGNKKTTGTSSTNTILVTIQEAPSRAQAVEAVTEYLIQRLARLLMIDNEAIQATHKSLASHGLDSMIGAEFRNWIFREFRVDIPFQQLLAGSLTIADLAAILCEKATKA